jgi:hypothetical protein
MWKVTTPLPQANPHPTALVEISLVELLQSRHQTFEHFTSISREGRQNLLLSHERVEDKASNRFYRPSLNMTQLYEFGRVTAAIGLTRKE